MHILKQERHNFIVLYINLYGKARASVLCNILKVSYDTIRRDFLELSRLGALILVHGAALAPGKLNPQNIGQN